VQAAFGHRLTDVDRLLHASQLLQADGLQYAVEADRRRSPRCSMVLPWQLHESFPNAWCTSSVDYHGEPKPAYHAVSRAFAADRATIRIDRMAAAGKPLLAEAWVWSEQGAAAGSTVVLRLRDVGGAVLAETGAAVAGRVDAPRAIVALTAPPVPPDAVAVWEAEWRSADGAVLDLERTVISTGADLTPLLEVPRAELDVRTEVDGDRWTIRIRHLAGPAAIGLGIHDARPTSAAGWPVTDGDPRPLLPGETRELCITWRGDDPAERALLLDGWNVAVTRVQP
jgi:beta-mannosidase